MAQSVVFFRILVAWAFGLALLWIGRSASQSIWKHLVVVPIEAKRDVADDFLFFTRVPKTGSENLVFLLQNLAKLNGFVHSRYWTVNKRWLNPRQQIHLVHRLVERKRKVSKFSFDGHVYFMDFERFEARSPTWISLVRDPVDKFVSRYYYSRIPVKYREFRQRNNSQIQGLSMEEWLSLSADDCIHHRMPGCQMNIGQPMDLTIPYFCGNAAECRILGSELALTWAKANVERWYPVVGILEHLEESLVVFQQHIPEFFANATQLYNHLGEPHKNSQGSRKRPISKLSKTLLRRNLTQEYEFYHFLKQRLFSQFHRI